MLETKAKRAAAVVGLCSGLLFGGLVWYFFSDSQLWWVGPAFGAFDVAMTYTALSKVFEQKGTFETTDSTAL